MSSHDVTPSAGLLGAGREAQEGPSRRSVLRGAAGAGAAGLTAAAVAGVAAPALAATPPARSAGSDGSRTRSAAAAAPEAGPEAAPEAVRQAAAEPVVVHVRDARSGEMDVFAGTSHTRLRDPDLAARLARAVR
jgi:hypothetical protein